MATRHPMIGFVLGLAGTGFAAPPGIFEVGASSPQAMSGHVGYSSYFSETSFIQVRLEELFFDFRPRLSNAHHALVGVGYEEEFSSHLFFRLTGGIGAGQTWVRDNPGNAQNSYFTSARISPDLTWFPSGRFTGISVGLNAGVNLQYRRALGDRPLPSGLSNQGAQIFAGLVL